MNVTIIGTGYVGLTTGTVLAYIGHHVTCIDKNEAIVRTLQEGRATIHEHGLEELLHTAGSRLRFRSEIPDLSGEGVVFIAVGTPPKPNGDADLSYVDSAAQELAAKVRPGARLVVVNKSTVPIGTGKHVESIVDRELARRGVEASVHVVSNPEFLAEGRAVHDSLYPDRIVIGTEHASAIGILRELYAPLLEQTFPAPAENPRPERLPPPSLVSTTTTSAELTKYAANAFLATKISFINEFARLAEHVGADINQVARAIGMDHRIGPHYLGAGIGWGGSCFGKDTRAIMRTGDGYDHDMLLVAAAVEVNERQRLHIVDKLQQHLKVLRGTTIGLLGLAFKSGTDDLRDAPAGTLIEALTERGARVRAHDPLAMPAAEQAYRDKLEAGSLEFCDDPVKLAQACDALVLVTDWPEYKRLDFGALKAAMRGELFLDARNLVDPGTVRAGGLSYLGVGR